ncbi:MAG: glutamyl-tRNA reductase [Thermoleophilia bacterium]
MHLAVLGINHKTAPVALREKVALSEEGCAVLSRRLLGDAGIMEVVPLSTCNRTEIYLVATLPDVGRREVLAALSKVAAVEPRELERCAYFHEGESAVAHLYRVAGSLDSLVVGEAQILGQIKAAYHGAHENETTSVLLNRLFRHSLEVGKRVRTETRIGENPVSVSSVAVEMVKKVFEDLAGRTVLLLGAGKMTDLTATHLVSHGVSRFVVANRTHARAREMARRLDGTPVAFEDIDDYLPQVDIVISSTGAPHYVLHKGAVKRAMEKRHNKPIFFIDIAVPRDIDPGVNDVYNAFLYDIDDLNEVAGENAAARAQEAHKAEHIIGEEVDAFMLWLSSLDVVPTITALREKAETIRDGELAKTLARLGEDLDDEERKQIEAMAAAIVNKMLHAPTVELKRAASERGGYLYVESIRRLFKLSGARRGAGKYSAAPGDAGTENTKDKIERVES